MTEQEVSSPVRITDNGVRSFIPPTFCFELWDSSGIRVAVVSQIVIESRDLWDFEALKAMQREDLRAVGHIAPYSAGPEARSAGARFTIVRTVGRDDTPISR